MRHALATLLRRLADRLEPPIRFELRFNHGETPAYRKAITKEAFEKYLKAMLKK